MASHELTDEEYKKQVASVWKVTGILSIVTITEVGFALLWFYKIEGKLPKIIFIASMIAASLVKAYYIVAEFMHLKYEKKSFSMSILIPLLIFLWGILVFLAEGDSVREMREFLPF